ncbi:YggS family pyridoxal phosphate-dependent enzyme [Shimazuella sp. AN120528]|uniref:YggS family pyridoxal phosphate-dependent enzyme n=1 Tax=Shimazuella soli TaxID=1892854 RepID=UPI001F0EE882|nr:YggS family pyridoxal phosphate-dependent enzyme [Shimazuella soli]MCH5584725.1 YggS family pyridoxal phosphate-dependent enzyme [Shimazuella soli]
MIEMEHFSKRIAEIRHRVEKACERAGRSPDEVNIVAVTKYVDTEITNQVMNAGCLHIGESRVQQAVPKWKQLGDRGTWHFIGHLQRNKAKDIVGRFEYLHALESLQLAAELDKRCAALSTKIKCFIQVNVSGEKTKFGISPAELNDFAGSMANFSHIELAGLMTMAPNTPDREEVRPVFRELRHLQKELQRQQFAVPHLSMGMSQDFEVAIEEGATFVRLGSILVGTSS